jgi:hypothetical protein
MNKQATTPYRPKQFLGLLDKKKQSRDLNAKIQSLIRKGGLPEPIKK